MVLFDKIDVMTVTMYCEDEMTDGEVCALSDNGTVEAPSAGDAFHGVVSHARGTLCGVILHGCVQVSYSGDTAPTVGWNILEADGDGGVAVAESGHEYLVLECDTTAETVTLYL